MRMLMSIVAAAALAGCASTESRGTRVTVNAETGDASVQENSYRLSNRVKVTKVTYDEVFGLKRATVTLESQTQRRQRLQARMVWLDAEGTQIDPDGKAFRPIVLDGNDVTTFTGVAPSEKAQTARMVIREMETVD